MDSGDEIFITQSTFKNDTSYDTDHAIEAALDLFMDDNINEGSLAVEDTTPSSNENGIKLLQDSVPEHFSINPPGSEEKLFTMNSEL